MLTVHWRKENKLGALRTNTRPLFSCYLKNKKGLRFIFSSTASKDRRVLVNVALSTADGFLPMPKALSAPKWGWTVERDVCPRISFSITWRQTLVGAWNTVYTGQTHTICEIAFPEVAAMSLEEDERAWMRHQEAICEGMAKMLQASL